MLRIPEHARLYLPSGQVTKRLGFIWVQYRQLVADPIKYVTVFVLHQALVNLQPVLDLKALV